ncbi:hypothetical protein I4U23_003575 [Adineta vaga]|nr:hypothetical protein I4U23_003575 [Adineta vaga]
MNFNDYTQNCLLYSARLQEGQLKRRTIDTNATVISFKNISTIALTMFSYNNETVYAIWNTTAGSNSSASYSGYNIGNYFPVETPMHIFDRNFTSSYTNYGSCSSWTLIYNGSSGLTANLGRNMFGEMQTVSNSTWYLSYRLLVTTKRDIGTAIEYGEVEFFT